MRAATAGTVAPSHLLLKFGKLTTKFEMLCKETGSSQFQNFGRETDGAVGAGGKSAQRDEQRIAEVYTASPLNIKQDCRAAVLFYI